MIRLPLLGCTLHTLKHCSIWRYRNSDGDVHGMEKKPRWEPPAWEVRHVLGAEETKQEKPNRWCNFPTVLLGVYPYCRDLWVAGSFLWSRYGVLDSRGWSWTCRAESWASDPPSSTQSGPGIAGRCYHALFMWYRGFMHTRQALRSWATSPAPWPFLGISPESVLQLSLRGRWLHVFYLCCLPCAQPGFSALPFPLRTRSCMRNKYFLQALLCLHPKWDRLFIDTNELSF